MSESVCDKYEESTQLLLYDGEERTLYKVERERKGRDQQDCEKEGVWKGSIRTQRSKTNEVSESEIEEER